MPLIEGKSPKSFSKNIKTEMGAGKPMKQSLAIAYAMKRKAAQKKMFEGGPVDSYNEQGKPDPFKEGYESKEKASGYMVHPMAKGGMIQEDEKKTGYQPFDMPYQPYKDKSLPPDEEDLNQHGQAETGEMGGMPSPKNHTMFDQFVENESNKKLNQHGEDDPGGSVPYAMFAYGDIVSKIMAQQQKAKGYSEGGRIANATPAMADGEENEFDDLVLRDDLKSSYGDDDNSGDSLDNDQENEDRSDIVKRIMKAKAMKAGRNPVPA